MDATHNVDETVPQESSFGLDGALKAYENKLKTAVRLKAAVSDFAFRMFHPVRALSAPLHQGR